MKTLHRFSYLLLIAVLLTSSSCIGKLFGGDDDDDVEINPTEEVNTKLDGDWTATSFIVDGEEFLGSVYPTVEMEYDKKDAESGEGEWTLVDLNDQFTRYDGTYELSDEGKQLDFSGETFEVSFSGETLRVRGAIQAGEDWDITAERD